MDALLRLSTEDIEKKEYKVLFHLRKLFEDEILEPIDINTLAKEQLNEELKEYAVFKKYSSAEILVIENNY